MKATAALSLLVFVKGALGHGGHDAHEGSGPAAGETIQQYAQRHMSSEHHIDSFDVRSFHHLHDLNRDGFWDRAEIEAIYGVHHVYSTKKSKDQEEHQKKADHIVDTILKRLDLDNDDRISPDELEKVGLDGLPNFDGMGAEGHHYDVESEFFLHHEEQFHSTPETQTDEAYNHPEDLEHFAHHETIEREEAEKEARFQGVTVQEILDQQALAAQAAQDAQHQLEDTHGEVPHHDEPVGAPVPVQDAPVPKVTRLTPPEKQEPEVRFKGASTEARRKGEWGSGEAGYKAPTEPSDKMRKNLPYKNRMQYKFRRNWGDF